MNREREKRGEEVLLLSTHALFPLNSPEEERGKKKKELE